MYNMLERKKGVIRMEDIELLDVYAMDRGIARLVSQMSHKKLNPICNKRYEQLGLNDLTLLNQRGIADKQLTDEVVTSILNRYQRIDNWYEYKHTLEAVGRLMYEYEQTTRQVHSHEEMLVCLSNRLEHELVFPKKRTDEMHERVSLMGNYLASQVNRSFSEFFRDIGFKPDSYNFLTDDIYTTVAEKLRRGGIVSL